MGAAPAATRDCALPAGTNRPSSPLPDTATVALASDANLPVRAAGGELAPAHGRRIVPWSGLAEPRWRLPLGAVTFVLIVALPMALAGIYYFFIAADQYVAEFRFGLRSAEPVRVDPGLLLQVGAAPSQIGLDSYVVVQYIASRAIVDDLDKTLNLQQMFSTATADWPARLHLPVPVEELVTYWRGQVDAFFDPTNGTVVVKARAFDPEDALKLAQGILASSERLVNGMSARARRDALRDSEDDVRRAEQRLATALVKLSDFRDMQGVVDPRKTADASAALDGRVRDDLVRANTELSTLKEYMQGDAPSLKLLEARIRALEAQRRALESEVTDTADTRSQALSRIMGSYEQLESERSFAESAYRHALEALDRARMNADRQHIYIAAFVQPRLPEKALYPRRLRALGIVFVIAFATWAIGCLTFRSVRDHL
jgi:capsular polysaccharide transport system permease protein